VLHFKSIFRVYGAAFFVLSLLCACNGSHDAGSALPGLTGPASLAPAARPQARMIEAAGGTLAIDAGGAATGSFAADQDYSPNGTWTSKTSHAIDVSGVSNPAPQAVYQTRRIGSTIAYTIPGLSGGAQYAVRLDFAESFWTAAGKRLFNVTVNGARVRTNFDIFATAGAANKAVALSFNVRASSSGTIAIALTAVTDRAAVNGIEIAPAGVSASPTPVPPGDINHVLVIGQSLALGSYGTPALTTAQPYNNLMFNTGILTADHSNAKNLVSFVPLVESVLAGTNHGETGWAAAANLTTALARATDLGGLPPPNNDYRILMSDDGASGLAYSMLMRGTAQYNVGLAQVTAGHSIAGALGLNHVVRALFVVHGETDQGLQTSNYESNLEAWQADYESDIRAITGQTAPVPMFVSQLSGNWGAVGTGGNAALIPQAQLQASLDAPTKIYLVAPKYMLTFSNGPHLINASYRQMGEYFAKAYRSVVVERKAWVPLRPASIQCTATTVDVAFAVPVAPLVIDTELVAKTGGYGFSFVNGSGKNVPISAVALSSASTVHIQLGGTLSGANNRLRYAYAPAEGMTCSSSAVTCNGSQTGPRGNIRDSDSTPSLYGNALFNWAVQFEEPCGTTAASNRFH
jgi:hypothetical protein